jgi:6-phosphogluconate dehydrogenase (decarboxylating)
VAVRAGVIGRVDRLAPWLMRSGLAAVVHAAADREAFSALRVDAYEGFFEALEHPRVFLLDLEPGPAVDQLIDESYTSMEPGDVVVDFSGSYWGDTLRRYRRMRHRSLYYLDAALVVGDGASALLVAGDARGVELASPTLARLAGEVPLVRAGEAGAAHFGLMLHDAWRTALAHAASEVHQALEAFPNAASPQLLKALTGGLGVGHGPRAAWLLDDAVRLEASTPLLAQAVMLEIATALDELRANPPPPRVGPFVHPDDIL